MQWTTSKIDQASERSELHKDRAGHTVKGIDPVSHARGWVIRMQENQIKVGDLVICEDTLFVAKEEI